MISHFKKISYIINVLQQTACLVVNPIMVDNYLTLLLHAGWSDLRLYDSSDLKTNR